MLFFFKPKADSDRSEEENQHQILQAYGTEPGKSGTWYNDWFDCDSSGVVRLLPHQSECETGHSNSYSL